MIVGCGLGVQAQTNRDAAAGGTNAPGEAPQAVSHSAVEAKASPAPTLISSDSWDFDMTRRTVVYRGHVRVDDPEMKLSCEWLTADLPETGERMTNIVALTNVVIDFTDDRGHTNHATGDKAVYVYAVRDGVTNETVTLTGNAQVENAQLTLTGEPVYWDRARNTLHADHERIILRQSLDHVIAATNAAPEIKLPANPTNSPPAAKRPTDLTNSPRAGTNLPPGRIENIDKNLRAGSAR